MKSVLYAFLLALAHPTLQAVLVAAAETAGETHARQLLDTSLPDITQYLTALQPENQLGSLFQAQQKRLDYLKKADRWITELQSKLDRMKFITASRMSLMGDRLNRRLKSKGFNPIIKYQRLYNRLMLPMVNPYSQMVEDNRLYTPPEGQADAAFQSFQQNLQNYSQKYADTIAQWQAGIWDENPEHEKYDG